MATRAHSFPECASFIENRFDCLRGLFHVERHRVHFDRSVQKAAGQNANTANTTAGGFGSQASQIGTSIIPGLERQAQGGQGLTPTQKNNALVASQEAVGGGGAGTAGAARLEAMRTRNPGGFSAALDEAARQRGRQTSANALGVENLDTQIANQKQAEAQRMLAGLYGTDTSRQLEAMGLANQDLNTELAAGRQGWLQNTEGVLDTISGMGSKAAGAYAGLR